MSAKFNRKGAENESATELKAARKDGITQTFQAVLGSVLTGQPMNVENTLAYALGNTIRTSSYTIFITGPFEEVSASEELDPVNKYHLIEVIFTFIKFT